MKLYNNKVSPIHSTPLSSQIPASILQVIVIQALNFHIIATFLDFYYMEDGNDDHFFQFILHLLFNHRR